MCGYISHPLYSEFKHQVIYKHKARLNLKYRNHAYYLWASWEKSSSNSSSSWFTLTRGATEVSVVEVTVASGTGVPFKMSSCRWSTRCNSSFSARPWHRSSSSLQQQKCQYQMIPNDDISCSMSNTIPGIIHKLHDTLLISTALFHKVNNNFLL